MSSSSLRAGSSRWIRIFAISSWAPSGANAQAWRFVEPVYRMTRPAGGDDSLRARNARATYELHDRGGGELTSVLFTYQRFDSASELLLGGSIYPAIQNFLLAARAQGLDACVTSWASYGGEQLLRDAVGVPEDWMLAGHVVVGNPRGNHGPLRPRPLADVVSLDTWGGSPPESVLAREVSR